MHCIYKNDIFTATICHEVQKTQKKINLEFLHLRKSLLENDLFKIKYLNNTVV